jgi:hypothetical protein
VSVHHHELAAIGQQRAVLTRCQGRARLHAARAAPVLEAEIARDLDQAIAQAQVSGSAFSCRFGVGTAQGIQRQTRARLALRQR